MAASELQVCYLDFDGVVSDCEVYWHPRRGIYVATPGRTLFEWTPILEQLLAPFPNVSLVLSTSWVLARNFKFAKSQLPPSLQRRVIGATFHNRMMRKDEFLQMPRAQQILEDVARRRPEKWFAIDDDATGWPPHLSGHLVLTHGHTGISDEAKQAQVTSILLSF